MDYKATITHWEALARHDPRWSILTDHTRKGGKWKKEEFFETGRLEIQLLFEFLEKNSFSSIDNRHALDFGCGVGRLSQALAKHYEKVTGVDASPTMIQQARNHSEEFGGKMNFVLNKDEHLGIFGDDSFSFILSMITLQHIPYPASTGFIREFIRILKPGGLLVFQIPTGKKKSSLLQKSALLSASGKGLL